MFLPTLENWPGKKNSGVRKLWNKLKKIAQKSVSFSLRES